VQSPRMLQIELHIGIRTCESIRKPLPVMAVPGIRFAVLDVRSCKENQIG
jgi:hypothetical protein